MAAAKVILMKDGPSGFTAHDRSGVIRRIAREIAVRPMTVHYYFKHGSDLLEAVQTGTYKCTGRFKPENRHPDMLLFLLATGWHVEELQRFARDGSVHPPLATMEVLIPEAYKAILTAGDGVVECSRAKRGGALKTRLSAPALEVAHRLKGTGGFNQSHLGREIHRACDALGIKRFEPGNMRHTVSSYAKAAGAPDPAVSAFLNHGSSTTLRYYDRGVALKVPTPL